MQSFEIKDVKGFMALLLVRETFDDFYAVSLKVKTFVETDIDGKLNPKWGESEAKYASWGMVRRLAYDIIKGNKSPERIKLVLMAGDAVKEKLLPETGSAVEEKLLQEPEDEFTDVDGMLNISYEEEKLTVTTGISMRTFNPEMSQNFSKKWDAAVESLLDNNELRYIVS